MRKILLRSLLSFQDKHFRQVAFSGRCESNRLNVAYRGIPADLVWKPEKLAERKLFVNPFTETAIRLNLGTAGFGLRYRPEGISVVATDYTVC
jgi:hypothetical protein